MTQALLVVDVQRGLTEGADAAHDAAGVVARIHTLAVQARAAGVPVIFVQHEGTDGYLEHGSSDWQLAPGLGAKSTDSYLRKTTPDAFYRTDLAERLVSVRELIICGLHSEYCVDTTTRRALALGYVVILVEDAHSTCDTPDLTAPQIVRHHNRTLTSIQSFGVRAQVLPSAEVRFEQAAD